MCRDVDASHRYSDAAVAFTLAIVLAAALALEPDDRLLVWYEVREERGEATGHGRASYARRRARRWPMRQRAERARRLLPALPGDRVA